MLMKRMGNALTYSTATPAFPVRYIFLTRTLAATPGRSPSQGNHIIGRPQFNALLTNLQLPWPRPRVAEPGRILVTSQA